MNISVLCMYIREALVKLVLLFGIGPLSNMKKKIRLRRSKLAAITLEKAITSLREAQNSDVPLFSKQRRMTCERMSELAMAIRKIKDVRISSFWSVESEPEDEQPSRRGIYRINRQALAVFSFYELTCEASYDENTMIDCIAAVGSMTLHSIKRFDDWARLVEVYRRVHRERLRLIELKNWEEV